MVLPIDQAQGNATIRKNANAVLQRNQYCLWYHKPFERFSDPSNNSSMEHQARFRVACGRCKTMNPVDKLSDETQFCTKCRAMFDTSRVTSIYFKRTHDVIAVAGSNDEAILRAQQGRQKPVPERVHVAENEDLTRAREKESIDDTSPFSPIDLTSHSAHWKKSKMNCDSRCQQ